MRTITLYRGRDGWKAEANYNTSDELLGPDSSVDTALSLEWTPTDVYHRMQACYPEARIIVE